MSDVQYQCLREGVRQDRMECAGHVVFALLRWAQEFLVTNFAVKAEISEHTAAISING